MNQERKRLLESNLANNRWKTWGPYVAERQWGTVREDYSPNGKPWKYVTHHAARSKAFRWGEEGLAGLCDDRQILCFSPAFWNTKDPMLKERLFGLDGDDGNHGEDVKECYYYLDSTPTHSYMKMLYKYPQEEFPYERLLDENKRRDRMQPEFELMDTGVFDHDRYFDIFIEYAKHEPDDILIRISVFNRGDHPAPLHVLPQIWFRNTWAWGYDDYKPRLYEKGPMVRISHRDMAEMALFSERSASWLFCENDTNTLKLYDAPKEGLFKDAIDDFIVHGTQNAVNFQSSGTKAAAHFRVDLAPNKDHVFRLRLGPASLAEPFKEFDAIFSRRIEEADEFYRELQTSISGDDAKRIQRQALAGMLWGKQFYYYDVAQWLTGDPAPPPPPESRKAGRNSEWPHLNNADILSMPDKWEYPWYASWDLAFHCIPLAMIDPAFAKEQLILLTREWYMHPNGQIPAYEWAFGDVNPPVHAWATWRVYKMDQKINDGKGDTDFLERVFHKLLLNFTWWVNRKDVDGNNLFQGGFLGLDNIGLFDRSKPLPMGGHIEQADGTSWMAMYSLNLMKIALELACTKAIYQDMATKFFEHFMYIAGAMVNIGGKGINLWDEEDKFYYDVLHLPDGQRAPLKVRSMVGLIPLFAVETLEPALLEKVPEFRKRMEWFLNYHKDLTSLVSRWTEPGMGERRLLSLLRGHRMKRLLKRMLDESEFLSEFGVRSLSKQHKDYPYRFTVQDNTFTIAYAPAESDTPLFGGNSNWRGPVWFPVNFLIIESLQKFHHYYGDDFKIEYPTGSGTLLTINDVADELGRRLTRLFLADANGRRPIFGRYEKMQTDPHFRDYILFHEYFNGDDGSGLGASHQTGWTGIVAKLLQPRHTSEHLHK